MTKGRTIENMRQLHREARNQLTEGPELIGEFLGIKAYVNGTVPEGYVAMCSGSQTVFIRLSEEDDVMDETQEAILHIVKREGGKVNIETILTPLDEIYPSRLVKKNIQKLVEEGKLEYGDTLTLKLAEEKIPLFRTTCEFCEHQAPYACAPAKVTLGEDGHCPDWQLQGQVEKDKCRATNSIDCGGCREHHPDGDK